MITAVSYPDSDIEAISQFPWALIILKFKILYVFNAQLVGWG